jgi:hypothetical protein
MPRASTASGGFLLIFLIVLVFLRAIALTAVWRRFGFASRLASVLVAIAA